MNNYVGMQIDQYMVTQYVARGGMAEVYLAQDTTLQRPVALKIMLRELAEDATFVARFKREALSVARLHHPHIVQIYTAGTTADQRPYLAMQYVSGGTLKDVLHKLHDRRQRLPVRDSLRLTRKIADALYTAHQAGIVHRDIKPSNILMHPDGTPVLTDLGIAAVSSATQLTRTDVTMGTPHYMSPEQAQGSKVDHRADLYALGIILFELLSGAVPFTGDSPIAVLNQHVNEPPPPLSLVQPGLHKTTYHVVEVALQKSAARRFHSAREMMAALDEALAAEAVVMPSPRTHPLPAADTAVHLPPQQTIPLDPYDPTYHEMQTTETDRSNRRWGYLFGGVVFALLVCGYGGWLLIRFASSLFTQDAFDPLPTPGIIVEEAAETAVSDSNPTTPPATPVTTAAVTAVRLRPAPSIDGNLSDWDNAAPVSIPFRTYQDDSWDGSEDIAAFWQLGWDDNNLYIGVTVIDDTLAQNQIGNQLFRGDSASLQIDTSTADNGQTLINVDDFQIDFSPGNFTTLPPAVFRFRGTETNQMLDALGHSIQIQATQTAGGYILEGAIPWLDLDVRPQAGQTLGAALNVTDNDQVETAVQETFYSHISTRTFRDPTTWGSLTLAP